MENKICILDIDGVLCNYPQAWIDFLNQNIPTKMQDKNLNGLKHKVPYSLYLEKKEKYRLSGIKRKIPPIKYAKEFTEVLEKKGYIIILMTKRPFLKYNKLFGDTLFWLNKNGIKFSTIFWGKEKHLQVIKYFPTADFIVEDNHKTANQIASFGYKVYLMNNPYNQYPIKENVKRINNLMEVIKYEEN